MMYLGCAGWSVPRPYVQDFPHLGSHLQRYAVRFGAVEINSSFYRAHRPQTYARWAASVPEGFRFAVKLPQTITHECRLSGCEALLDACLEQFGQLRDRLGCLLVQLPPSLEYEEKVAQHFFESLRIRYPGPAAIEPRHSSWRAAHSMLLEFQIAQVAASPSRFEVDALPGGWPGLVYWRLHGVPRIYYSAYSEEYLQRLAAQLEVSITKNVPVWCIFDNTTSGAALGNALAMQSYLMQRTQFAPHHTEVGPMSD